ncbi:MAG: ferrous iron transport protein A [Geminocystis sp.]|nr:ferrous iron transport protein A [Geminocystis sp.]MDW8464593.1 ferrous iron transport protein A [Geminocystis sp.]
MKAQQRAMVSELRTQDEALIRHLVAMGIREGCTIFLESKFPSYVVQVHRGRAAFDRKTADCIWVIPIP